MRAPNFSSSAETLPTEPILRRASGQLALAYETRTCVHFGEGSLCQHFLSRIQSRRTSEFQ